MDNHLSGDDGDGRGTAGLGIRVRGRDNDGLEDLVPGVKGEGAVGQGLVVVVEFAKDTVAVAVELRAAGVAESHNRGAVGGDAIVIEVHGLNVDIEGGAAELGEGGSDEVMIHRSEERRVGK